jgi:Protein of unknown function (DUF2442)
MEQMARMTRPRLTDAEVLPDFKMRLTFRNGGQYTVDFVPFFEESKGLAPLHDPVQFAGVQVDPDGWIVEWPAHDIQIGADTLWLDAQAQNAEDENTRIFAQWRSHNGLTLPQAAEALGMTVRTMSAYGTGARPVPRYVALACKGWEVEHSHG